MTYRDSHTPHSSLTGRICDRDELHLFPVVDCPECKLVDAPYSISVLNDGTEYITRWFCLNCGYSVPERPKIKGWVSLSDLEEANWETEL